MRVGRCVVSAECGRPSSGRSGRGSPALRRLSRPEHAGKKRGGVAASQEFATQAGARLTTGGIGRRGARVDENRAALPALSQTPLLRLLFGLLLDLLLDSRLGVNS